MGIFGWSYPPGAAGDPNAPWNQDDPPIAEHAVVGRSVQCPSCQEMAVWEVDSEEPGPTNDYTETQVHECGWRCPECDWWQDVDGEVDSRRLAEFDSQTRIDMRVKHLRRWLSIWRATRVYNVPAITRPEEFFFVPAGLEEGVDFYLAGEADGSEWTYYQCGERDCPVQWHKTISCHDLERKDGKRSITEIQIDEDGNSDSAGGWEEGEDWDASGVGHDIDYKPGDFFAGNIEYAIWQADTGLDPLNDVGSSAPSADPSSEKWVNWCLGHAEDNARCLRGEIQRIRDARKAA